MAVEAAGTGSATSKVSEWLDRLKLAGGIMAVVGVIAYGLLRLAYVQFYSRFDVLPEDAGLGKAELLSQALVGPAVLLIVAVGATIALLLLSLVLNSFYYALVRALVFNLLKHTVWRNQPAAETEQAIAAVEQALARFFTLPRSVRDAIAMVIHGFRRIAIGGVIVALLTTASALFVFAQRAADTVLHAPHWTLQGRSLGVGRYSLPLLDVRALSASLDWVGSGTAPPILTADDGCLMYLGQTDDSVLIYDATEASTVRLQKGNVVVAIHTEVKQLPDRC